MKFFMPPAPGRCTWSCAVLLLLASATGSVLRGDMIIYEADMELEEVSERQHSIDQTKKMDSIHIKHAHKERTSPNALTIDQSVTNSTSTFLDDRNCDKIPLVNGHVTWDRSRHRMKRQHKQETHICGPKVLIIGAMKCGTNTIGHILAKSSNQPLSSAQTTMQ